jgi:hypothetical protein
MAPPDGPRPHAITPRMDAEPPCLPRNLRARAPVVATAGEWANPPRLLAAFLLSADTAIQLPDGHSVIKFSPPGYLMAASPAGERARPIGPGTHLPQRTASRLVMKKVRENARRPAVRCPGLGLTERRLCRAEQVDLYALRPRWHGCLLARVHVSAFSSRGPNVVPDRAPGSVAEAYDLRGRGARVPGSRG